MSKSDKTARLHKSINLNLWRVFKGKNHKYVVVCGTIFFMEGSSNVES